MRIRTRAGKEALLGYCANVHPGESLAHVENAMREFAAKVREKLNTRALSLGLWLSRSALDDLERAGTERLADTLASAGLFVCTMNGFPYGNFHAEVVKRQVYHPDLGTAERREYLFGLAKVLSRLLPEDADEGTISTLPIGHSAELDPTGRERACVQLCTLVQDLAGLREQSGRSIRICLEPEPGCALESTADVLRFFGEELPLTARRLGTSAALIAQHLGVCYDTCHQAVAFEDAASSLRAIVDADITIGKVQLSSALEIREPGDPAVRAELATFDEPRFLHQVRAEREDGSLAKADDLPEIAALPSDRVWRVHFHVPIHRELMGRIVTTRDFLDQALATLASLERLPHLEVETYTWSVLP
jgi:hypothetical protein